MNEERIAELIKRRRLQLLIHSIIYYRFDETLISDWQWTEWAKELVQLQKDYPEIAKKCPYADAYEGFDYSTGYNLPLQDPWAVNKALALLEYKRKMMK